MPAPRPRSLLTLALTSATVVLPATAQAASVTGTVHGAGGWTVLAVSSGGAATAAKTAELLLPQPGARTGAAVNRVDVDCLALPYCRAGTGTATASNGGSTPPGLAGRTWSTIDDDRDGLPDLPASLMQPGAFSLQVQPNVGTADISPGDTYQLRLRTPGGDVIVPAALGTYFLTTPAVAAIAAVAAVDGQAVAYPVTPATVGTQTNPVHLTGDGMRVELWRPSAERCRASPGP